MCNAVHLPPIKLGWRIDRNRLRDIVNTETGCFVASYEPAVNDVSVSIKHVDNRPLPHNGAVYPRWSLNDGVWSMVTCQEVMRLVPHATIHRDRRIHTFRVFATGSVVQVGRWPCTMQEALQAFLNHMSRLRTNVMDRSLGTMYQSTLYIL